MSRYSLIIASLVALRCTFAEASPQTVLTFDRFATGSEVGARFGAEVDCSGYDNNRGLDSVVVVGAPNGANGEGRVYLFDPLSPSAPRQIIEPSAGTASRKFGTSIEFIDDISADGLDDLLIGAPGDDLSPVGQIFAFISSYSGGVLRYIGCGAVSGPLGFGDTLQALRSRPETLETNAVVGNPRYGRVDGVSVTLEEGNTCQFSLNGEFSGSRGETSRFGDSIAQVSTLRPDGSRSLSLQVAAAAEGYSGVVHQLQIGTPVASTEVSGTPSEVSTAGSVVSAHRTSSFHVIGVPRHDDFRGSVAVYGSLERADQPYCSINNPITERSGTFGSTVHLLGAAFREFDANTTEVVALRRNQVETGGGLALVGVNPSGCSELFPVNNCRRDSGQEQGSAIVGGVDCGVWRNGRVQWLLVSGSPGSAGGRGRVDIGFEEGLRATPVACADEASDLLSVTGAESPIDEDTIEISPTATPAESATSTPLLTATVSPTATGSIETVTPTPMPTAVATVGETVVPTVVPVTSVTIEASVTPALSPTSVATTTPMPTISATPTSVATNTSTPSPTATSTSTASSSPTSVPTDTSTPLPTATSSSTAVASSSASSSSAWTCQPDTLPVGSPCNCNQECESQQCHGQMRVCISNYSSHSSSSNSSANSMSSSPSSSVPDPGQSDPTTPSATAAPIVSMVPTIQDAGVTGGTAGIGDSPAVPTVVEDRPIVVGPGASGLPAPSIAVRGGAVQVMMPSVRLQLSTEQRAKAVSELQRQRRISKNRAAQLLDNPNNLVVTYIVHYLEVTSGRRFAFIQSAYAQEPNRRAAKIRQIRSRQREVTLRALRPGASYRVYYTVEASAKRSRMVLGVTQPSAATTFTVPQ